SGSGSSRIMSWVRDTVKVSGSRSQKGASPKTLTNVASSSVTPPDNTQPDASCYFRGDLQGQ
ncbi:hypothetical protein A2U01_0058913, partial [Trifolium medium]|nr:hypothetical protein [Trifolium medium]